MRAHDRERDATPVRNRPPADDHADPAEWDASAPPERALELQRLIGNAATSRLITAQRLVGFEAEIDLPVTKGNGQMFDVGDTKLGTSTMPLVEGGADAAFEVVTDKRSRISGDDYSNMEFVTGAVSVVGPDKDSGPERLRGIADEIRTVENQFYTKAAANPRSRLQGGALNLVLTTRGRTAKLARQIDYRDTREAGGDGGLFVHYSLGVPVTGMPAFFDALRAEDPYDRPRDRYNSDMEIQPGYQVKQARWRLHQAKEFGEGAVGKFRDWLGADGRESENSARDEAALNGYCQLVYTQLAGMADVMAEEGQPKNSVTVLSRSDLATVRVRLPEAVQDFIDTFDVTDENNVFAELFDDLQQRDVEGNAVGFSPGDDRQVDDGSRVVTFENYANSAFRRDGSAMAGGDVTQEEVFGGMNTIAPHEEHGSVMVPMEIRRLGGPRKTWDQLKRDLTNLAEWAQRAYQKDQDVAAPPASAEHGEPMEM